MSRLSAPARQLLTLATLFGVSAAALAAGADLGQEGSDWTDGLAPATAEKVWRLTQRRLAA